MEKYENRLGGAEECRNSTRISADLLSSEAATDSSDPREMLSVSDKFLSSRHTSKHMYIYRGVHILGILCQISITVN